MRISPFQVMFLLFAGSRVALAGDPDAEPRDGAAESSPAADGEAGDAELRDGTDADQFETGDGARPNDASRTTDGPVATSCETATRAAGSKFCEGTFVC